MAPLQGDDDDSDELLTNGGFPSGSELEGDFEDNPADPAAAADDESTFGTGADPLVPEDTATNTDPGF